MYIGYLPSPNEIREKRIKDITYKLTWYEHDLSSLNTKLITLRNERKRINWDGTISIYEKNKQLRKIERKGNAVKREINHVNEQIALRKSRLQTAKSPWLHTHCYSCGASIDRKSISRCPVCKWTPCPKCHACLCSYRGRK
jgi:predicted Zn-ribbon and HTH transcriptional regulator